MLLHRHQTDSFCIMGFKVVFLALVALGAAVPQLPKHHAANQELVKKQQDVICLLENLIGEIPNDHLRDIGHNYNVEANLEYYENPNLVKYLVTAVKTGNFQPKGTVFTTTLPELRQEVILLTRILLGAKNYQTFLNTAAWARVHLNELQFAKALIITVLQHPELQGVVFPPTYEILPHYYFDTRVIQEVQNIKSLGINPVSEGKVLYIPINYTSHLPEGEHRVAYFTEDIGLNNYYEYLQHTIHMLPEVAQKHHVESKVSSGVHTYEDDDYISFGARWFYLHQQLLAHYNLERLGNGLGLIKELDYKNVDIPFKPHLSYVNGLEFSGRPNGPIDFSVMRQKLYRYVLTLEKRIVDAIDSGSVITAHGSLLSLYQPQGCNILADLIQGTGRSVNPRYYGSFVEASKVLLGGTPEFDNIWEYTPSALEIGATSIRDPAFYMLFNKIVQLFKHYQESLPAYQYNDVVLPGVQIQQMDVSKLVTYFQDYIVNLDNAGIEGVWEHEQKMKKQEGLDIKGLLKRLDHQPYEYHIHVQCDKPVSDAVVRVYLGPKFDHEGLPVDINTHRHSFVELDQWLVNLVEGENIISRNSQQSSIHSADLLSIDEILKHVENAASAQSPFYVIAPQQVYGFPSRLSLPKGTYGGFPLQFLVIISTGHNSFRYGPIIPDSVNSYFSHSYQPVSINEYERISEQPDKSGDKFTMLEVIPELSELGISQVKSHWTNLYNKYHGYYNQPQFSHFHLGHVERPSYVNMQHFTGQGLVEKVSGLEHGVYSGSVEGLSSGYESGKYKSIYQNHIHGGSENKAVYGAQTYPEGVYGQRKTIYEQGKGMRGSVLHQNVGIAGMSDSLSFHGKSSGIYGGINPIGVHDYVPGTQTQTLHDQVLQKYHENLPISEVIGGAISLDGKPLGWPLDRQLGVSVWNAPNVYVQDVFVYHYDVPVTHVTGIHQ